MLDSFGNWKNPSEAESIYDTLKSRSSRQMDEFMDDGVSATLAKEVKEPHGRVQALRLAIKLGLPGSDRRLVDLLNHYGNRQMAEDYLNCGWGPLQEAATDWAHGHGYEIRETPGTAGIKWGSF